MGYRIQNRRDTAARWAEINPILLEGEIGYVIDNPNQYKIGDGVNAWNSLPLRGFNGTIAPTLGYNDDAVPSQRVITERFDSQSEKLSELGSEVDSRMVDGLWGERVLNYYPNSSNVWENVSECLLVPVSGCNTIRLKRKVSNQYIGFLKTRDLPKVGMPVNYCDGTNKILLDLDDKTIDIPKDAVMIYIQTKVYISSEWVDCTPDYIDIDGIEFNLTAISILKNLLKPDTSLESVGVNQIEIIDNVRGLVEITTFEAKLNAYISNGKIVQGYANQYVNCIRVNKGDCLKISDVGHLVGNTSDTTSIVAFSEGDNIPTIGGAVTSMAVYSVDEYFSFKKSGYVCIWVRGESKYVSAFRIEPNYKHRKVTLTEALIIPHSYITTGGVITDIGSVTQVMQCAVYRVSKSKLYHITEVGHPTGTDLAKVIFTSNLPNMGTSGTVLYDGTTELVDRDYVPIEDGYITVFHRNRYPTESVSESRYIDFYELVKDPLTERVKDLLNKELPFEGKKMSCIGDSITAMRRWQPFAVELLGCEVDVSAISGGTLCNVYYDTITAIDLKSDIITIQFGTNDWANESLSLGSIADMAEPESDNTPTYCGALNYICKYISENIVSSNPYCKVLLWTPLKRLDGIALSKSVKFGKDEDGRILNHEGKTLADFADAIIKIGGRWGFTVLDTHRTSGINEITCGTWSSNYTPSEHSTYEDWSSNYTGNLLYDGLHPNFLPAGKILGEKIAKAILNI